MKIEYNRSAEPPAPFLDITVFDPAHPSERRIIPAKVDSAADITALPASLVQALALTQTHWLKVAGYDSQEAQIAVYDAAIEVAHVRAHIEVIAIPEDYALLGRDILNQLRLLLDGPAHTLEILE